MDSFATDIKATTDVTTNNMKFLYNRKKKNVLTIFKLIPVLQEKFIFFSKKKLWEKILQKIRFSWKTYTHNNEVNLMERQKILQ